MGNLDIRYNVQQVGDVSNGYRTPGMANLAFRLPEPSATCLKIFGTIE